MRPPRLSAQSLAAFLLKRKIATLSELKKALGTHVTMSVYRKLKQLNYLSSCSHSGKYYTLKRITQFDNDGLWRRENVLFSSHGSLGNTIHSLIARSGKGYTANEIEKLLNVKPNESLIALINKKLICREKISSNYVYFSNNAQRKKQQSLSRRDTVDPRHIGEIKPDVLLNELKAALIIFFSILNEKQQRLYVGLESLKLGRGGDKMISELFGINCKTVARGRTELLRDTISIDTIRDSGGGRKKMEKKT